MSISSVIKKMLPDIDGISAYMSSDFGSRESFIDYHEGVDFSYNPTINATKPKVYSPVSGTVVSVKIDGSGRVTIKDDNTGLYHDIIHSIYHGKCHVIYNCIYHVMNTWGFCPPERCPGKASG